LIKSYLFFLNPLENDSIIVPLGLLRKTPLEKVGVFSFIALYIYGRIWDQHENRINTKTCGAAKIKHKYGSCAKVGD